MRTFGEGLPRPETLIFIDEIDLVHRSPPLPQARLEMSGARSLGFRRAPCVFSETVSGLAMCWPPCRDQRRVREAEAATAHVSFDRIVELSAGTKAR